MRIRNPFSHPLSGQAATCGGVSPDCCSMRHTPELRFCLDEGAKRGLELTHLIDAATGDSPRGGESPGGADASDSAGESHR